VLALRFFNFGRCFEDIAAGLALVSYGGYGGVRALAAACASVTGQAQTDVQAASPAQAESPTTRVPPPLRSVPTAQYSRTIRRVAPISFRTESASGRLCASFQKEGFACLRRNLATRDGQHNEPQC